MLELELKTTYDKAKGSRFELMEANMKENEFQIEQMEKEGRFMMFMKDSDKKIKRMDLEVTCVLMAYEGNRKGDK